jgi:splicing factor U2AF 65 kDa subunit
MFRRTVPLHLRERRLNLFDVGNELAEAVDCIEDMLDARINITQNIDKELYTPLVVPRLKRRGLVEADVQNSRMVLCYTQRDPGSLHSYLGRYIRQYRIDTTGSATAVMFADSRDAAFCMSLSNRSFLFLRPRDYVEIGENPARNKYSSDVLCTDEKIIMGPLDIDPVTLRDVLDNISPLSGFRQCKDRRFFVFAFQTPELTDLFLTTTSHIAVAGASPISQRAYHNCFLLNLSKYLLDRTPRRMSGPIALSTRPTRIVVLLNVIGPWDNASGIEDLVAGESSKFGKVKDVVIPRGEGISRTPGSNKIFIECKDVESATNIYLGLGGLLFDGRVVATGYYPELNYRVGEYE